MTAEGAAIDALVGDRYQIVCELGRGGMGVVYLGRDRRRDMDVAIKLCHRSRLDAMLWLKREFRVVSSLRHPNLVELFELVAHDQSCYFTMEYVVGLDPREWVEHPVRRSEHEISTSTLAPLRLPSDTSPGPPPNVDFARVRAVLAQLADAIAFLHARGVIHRDVKPSNVLVASGSVKLLDFGIALERRRVGTEVARERRVVGTGAYLAPEYVEKLAVTPAIDVYALGVLAFELVTGTSPFGRSPYGSADRRGLALPLASRVNPAVPSDLDELIDQMLAANPARRPTAAQIATRLAGVLTQPRGVRRSRYFVGRAREVARLDTVIGDRTLGARCVVVSGPSGVGKTALVEEVLGRARITAALPAFVWRGRCHERELIPYRAFDFVVDDLAAEIATSRRDDATSVDVAIEHAGTLGRIFPALGALFELVPPLEDLRVERDRALVAVAQVFDRVIGSAHGLVVIDDLQWADEGSLELLQTIVERVTRPLTIIATWSDSSDVDPRLAALVARIRGAEVLAVPPLAADEVAELIGDVAPAAPRASLRAASELAAGNPYLAELIGRELAETGSVSAGDEHHLLARLAPAERAVTEIAALAPGVVTFEQLRALAELPPAALVSVLRGLEDAHVLRVSPNATGAPVYVFYHQRLHAAARAAIAGDTARALHLRFAQLGERDAASPEQLAFHYEHAGELGSAARWAVVAADAARDQLAWGVAIDGYRRALALGDPGDCRVSLADCLFFGGQLAEAATLFEQLAEQTGDRDIAEHRRVRAAEAYLKLGEIDRGLAIVDGVLARRGEPRARSRLASASRTLAVTARWLAGRPAHATLDRLLTPFGSAARPGDPVRVAAYRVIASFLSTPYPIEAFEYVMRGIAAAEQAGDRDAHGLGMAMLAAYVAAGSLGRFGDGVLARAHRLSDRSTTPYPRMVIAGATGILATLRGDWAGMRRAHDEGHGICMRLGLQRSWEASFLRTYQGLGELYAGEPTRALAILDELADTSDDLISRALLGSYRGRALLVAGDLDGARAQLRALEQTSTRGLAGIYRQVFVGELALAEGAWARAAAIGGALARDARAQWLSAIPALSAMIDTLIATAEIGTGDRAAAGRARRRASALYRRARYSFYAATALRLVAQAELRLGVSADRALARAAEVAGERGGRLDRLAIAALRTRADAGPLATAVTWATGGMA